MVGVIKLEEPIVFKLAAAVVSVAFIGLTASPVDAAVRPDVIVGDAYGTTFSFTQTTGDCEEAAADVLYGEYHGSRLSEKHVIATAQKLSVLAVPAANGSNWFGPDGIVKLLHAWGIPASTGMHTIQTIEADLSKGDRVVALVNAETLWESAFPGQYVTTDRTQADHVVALDQIDLTRQTALITDSAVGTSYVVPLTVFRQAERPGGNEYAVATK